MSALDKIIDGSAPGDGIVAPRIRCVDGYNLSVQASWGHYCTDSAGRRPDATPGHNRNGDATLPYTAVEVGYPSSRPEPWHCAAWRLGYDDHSQHEVCDGWEAYESDEGIYAFVPVQMVRDLVASHGGERGVSA